MKPLPARMPTSVLVPLAIVVLVAMATATVTSHQVERAGTRTASLATVQQGSLPQTVPLRLVAGHLMVDVTLGDGPPVPMLLDTGAPTSLSTPLAARIGAAPSRSIVVRTPDGHVTRMSTVSIRELRLGPVTFRDVGAALDVVPPESDLADVAGNGIIGADLMAEAVWQIDYAARRLTIATSVEDLDHVDGAVSLPFTPASASSQSPLIHLGIGSGRSAFLVDTGSDGGLALHPEDLARVGLDIGSAHPPERATIATATGSHEAGVSAVPARVRFSHEPARPMSVLASDILTPGMGLAGNEFLADHVLTIDWPARRIYLDPVRDATLRGPPTRRSAS